MTQETSPSGRVGVGASGRLDADASRFSKSRPDALTPKRPDAKPWVIGIIIGLALVAIANAVFIYVAVKGADPVVPSYIAEPR